jgi:hypothetical protein
MTKLTLEQVLKMAPSDKKSKIQGMAKGTVGVYCVAVRDKVKLDSAYFEMRHQKNGRTVVSIVGSSPKCVTADGKKTSARSIVLNMATKDYKKGSGTVREKSSRSRSPKRRRSGSRKSPKRRRSGSRSRSPKRRRSGSRR